MQERWRKIILKDVLYAIMALFFIGVFFVSASKAQASNDHIVINEIYASPLTGEKEWVELYNPTIDDIDLANYSLKDGANPPRDIVSNSFQISSNNYFVFETPSGWLNGGSGGEILFLLSKNDGSIVDKVAYGGWTTQVLINNSDISSDDNAPLPASDQSISRIANGIDTDVDKNDFQIVPITKGSENILPSPIVYSDKIYINELLPQPATGSADEYIELYNSSNKDEDLVNWQLDAETFVVSTIIKAQEYRLFKKSEFNIGLTDIGDTTNLIDPNGEIKSSATYGKSIRGQSYSKFADNYQWTTTLTPGAENLLTAEIVIPDQDIPILEIDIIGARNQPDGQVVSTTGTVSVVPGKLSSQYFYIQDGKSGIQIYNYNKLFQSVNIGDQIRVTGEMASMSGERRIKILQLSDIIILSTHPPPEPIKTTIFDIAENFEGEYVVVTGIVTRTSGNTFYIHGSGEIQVSIREGTGIKKPRMSVGDKVQVAGILSQYGDSYRILPIIQSDVKIISSSGLPNSGPGVYIAIIISTLLAWNIQAILLKRRRKQLKYFYLKIPM